MSTTTESPAVVEIDTDAFWGALESFFRGSVSEARQMRTKDFGGMDCFVSSSVPLLSVEVDGETYGACIHRIDKAGMYLAGSVVTVGYFASGDETYTYVKVELVKVGAPSCPQAQPTAVQKRWEVTYG
ncbi:MAG: hypothetical protein WBP12_02575 [Candidatus Saccharimonas sp.]